MGVRKKISEHKDLILLCLRGNMGINYKKEEQYWCSLYGCKFSTSVEGMKNGTAATHLKKSHPWTCENMYKYNAPSGFYKFSKAILKLCDKSSRSMKRKFQEDDDKDYAPECPVCMTEILPPKMIFKCSEGHFFCSDCKARLEACATCPEQNGYIGRNRFVEKRIRSKRRENNLRYWCPLDGCNFSTSTEEMRNGVAAVHLNRSHHMTRERMNKAPRGFFKFKKVRGLPVRR